MVLECLIMLCGLVGASLMDQAFYPPSDYRISYIGRFSKSELNYSFAWPGAQIRTIFSGTSITISLRDPRGQYDVFIDGNQTLLKGDSAEVKNYTLNNVSLADIEHTLVLRRRTEVYADRFGEGRADFLGILVDPGKIIKPFAQKEVTRRIEVIGDSVSCGYGNLGNPPCEFSFDTEDIFQTYGAKVAASFDAELHVVCWSGKGVVRNFNSTPGACEECPDVMPAYFNHTLDQVDGEEWNFDTWQPDVVLINLGVNDFDPDNAKPALSPEVFVQKYKEWIVNQVLAKYSNKANLGIFLLCGGGNFPTDFCQHVERVAFELSRPNIAYIDTSTIASSDVGCEKHPNVAGHEKIANLVIPEVGKFTKWTPTKHTVSLETESAVLLGAFFVVALAGHLIGCVRRKPRKDKPITLLETKVDR